VTTITIVGVAADHLGHSIQHGYGLDERSRAHHYVEGAAVPAASYHAPKNRIPLDWRHGRHVGQVVYLERGDKLTLVAEADTDHLGGIDLFGEPVYLSPETWEERSRHGVEAELLAVALTPTPASIALPAVHVLHGSVDVAQHHTTGNLHDVLSRAALARSRRRYPDPIGITDLGEQRSRGTLAGAAPGMGAVPARLADRPRGPIEYGPPGRIIAVRGVPVGRGT
jgi:hypothetical protein